MDARRHVHIVGASASGTTTRRISRQTARGFLPGLHAFLDRLEAQIEGRVLPDWRQRFGELQAEYPEWSGHAPPPGQ